MSYLLVGTMAFLAIIAVAVNWGDDDFKTKEREFHMKHLDDVNPKVKS